MKFSEKEIRELLTKFHRMDRNGDNILTLKEIRKVYVSSGLPESSANQFMALFDLDGDNVVTLDEYILALGLTPPPPNDVKQWKAAFDAMDTDGSGSLSRDEIRQLLQRYGYKRATEEDIEQWIETLDKNGDGEISFPEFSAFMEMQCQNSSN
ncbi:unnamed protein product [Calicophoron daubneyi]|uniref:EF-hand domain-containing protein n=1 Tax=Calicophoron daubneyi TaxID=300641 RepID=A0AAV2TK34_CALDB